MLSGGFSARLRTLFSNLRLEVKVMQAVGSDFCSRERSLNKVGAVSWCFRTEGD
jgi:hypothetical protein